jgi:glycogen synthase
VRPDPDAVPALRLDSPGSPGGRSGETIEDGPTRLLFDEYTPNRLDWTLDRAIVRYANPEGWQDMVLHAMAEDFSWERVVDKYYVVYERAQAIRRGSWTSS